jgi:hypothetical protein
MADLPIFPINESLLRSHLEDAPSLISSFIWLLWQHIHGDVREGAEPQVIGQKAFTTILDGSRQMQSVGQPIELIRGIAVSIRAKISCRVLALISMIV